MADWIEVLLRGGQTGMLGLAAVVLVWAVRTLTRYQDLLKDYPPHRHINGTRIVYPKEYQPAPIEHLAEGGD